ncbi:MAG: class II aldolase/adducin family protein [Magnetococcus sp. DMHC-1]|nr:class II aldolase [Magnetococcales bacterium]
MSLSQLSRLSRRLGENPLLVQGPGGNTSLKDQERLYVKGSGTWLRDAENKSVFTMVHISKVLEDFNRNQEGDPVTWKVDAQDPLRPSIETTLHALMPQRVVLHVHSIRAIALTLLEDAPNILAQRLAGIPHALVPYRRPGLPLTLALQAANSSREEMAPVQVLVNHGLVIGATDCQAAESLLTEIEERLTLPIRPSPPPDLPTLREHAQASGWQLPTLDDIHRLATDPCSLAHACLGPVCPDQVVYLGAAPLIPAPGQSIQDALAAWQGFGPRPIVALVPGKGVLVAPNFSPAATELLTAWASILGHVPPRAPIKTLDDSACAALLGWEAEQYRQKQA